MQTQLELPGFIRFLATIGMITLILLGAIIGGIIALMITGGATF